METARLKSKKKQQPQKKETQIKLKCTVNPGGQTIWKVPDTIESPIRAIRRSPDRHMLYFTEEEDRNQMAITE